MMKEKEENKIMDVSLLCFLLCQRKQQERGGGTQRGLPAHPFHINMVLGNRIIHGFELLFLKENE